MLEGPAAAELQRLIGNFNRGAYPQVVAGTQRLLRTLPDQAVLHSLLGAAQVALGEYALGMNAFSAALALQPGSVDVHCNLANAQAAQGLFDDAAASFRRALAIQPRSAQAKNGLGTVLRQLGEADAALQAFDDAIASQPGFAEAAWNRAAMLHVMGRLEEALGGYDGLLAGMPQFAQGHWQRGCVLMAMGHTAAAIAGFERAIAADPQLAEAHIDMGNALLRQGSARDAERYLRQATQLAPANASGFLNLGVALHDQGDLAGAEAAYRKSLSIEPVSALALSNLGSVLQDSGRFDEAVSVLEQALTIAPEDMNIRISKLHQQARICDWRAYSAFAELGERLIDHTRPANPWQVLSFEDNPVRNRQLSQAWLKALSLPEDLPAPPRAVPAASAERIRIGYFSADFQAHATMHLMGGLMAQHDRARFEITAFSFGPDHDDPVRRRLIQDVEHFIDVKGLSDPHIAALAQSRGIDIAVDLKGYTADSRPGIFAHRAAPVQVSYLGYPGTLGAPFMDYVIGDSVVFTTQNRTGFSESLIQLAGSYQVNDRTRVIADTVPSRGDFGLPDDAFVFCCFNNTFKIAPDTFAIWMRLLRATESSVLWLLRTTTAAEANLRREAQAQAIAPDRLVFAAPQPPEQHLARHCHIDLFLDTFNYNAHTTASDALWAGVPIVTKAGAGFAARVAASLLHAVGLPDLVTHDAAAYEALALALATDPPRLSAIKARLAANRLTHPLFDTALFARQLEEAYTAIHARALRGEPPSDLMMA